MRKTSIVTSCITTVLMSLVFAYGLLARASEPAAPPQPYIDAINRIVSDLKLPRNMTCGEIIAAYGGDAKSALKLLTQGFLNDRSDHVVDLLESWDLQKTPNDEFRATIVALYTTAALRHAELNRNAPRANPLHPNRDRLIRGCEALAALIGKSDDQATAQAWKAQAQLAFAGGSGGGGGGGPPTATGDAFPDRDPPDPVQPKNVATVIKFPNPDLCYRILVWHFLKLVKQGMLDDELGRQARTKNPSLSKLRVDQTEPPMRSWLFDILEICLQRRLLPNERDTAWRMFLAGNSLEEILVPLTKSVSVHVPEAEPLESRVCIKSFPWSTRPPYPFDELAFQRILAGELPGLRDRVRVLADRVASGVQDLAGLSENEQAFVRSHGRTVDLDQLELFAEWLELMGHKHDENAVLALTNAVAERYALPKVPYDLDEDERDATYLSKPALVSLIRQYHHWAMVKRAGQTPLAPLIAYLDERPYFESLLPYSGSLDDTILRTLLSADQKRLYAEKRATRTETSGSSYEVTIRGNRQYRLRVELGFDPRVTFLSD